MLTADFDYVLPPELIAQKPAPDRDQSRLLVLQRPDGRIAHRRFADLPEYLRAGDVLVLNDSRVVPARLRGVKAAGGGQIEVLLVEEKALNDWWVMLRPGKRVRAGTRILFADRHGQPTEVRATVIEKSEEGHCRIQFSGPAKIVEALEAIGEAPLPPYIARDAPGLAAFDREPVRLCLPGPHPALRTLLDARWRIDDRDCHMSSGENLVSPGCVPSPSLA